MRKKSTGAAVSVPRRPYPSATPVAAVTINVALEIVSPVSGSFHCSVAGLYRKRAPATLVAAKASKQKIAIFLRFFIVPPFFWLPPARFRWPACLCDSLGRTAILYERAPLDTGIGGMALAVLPPKRPM